MSHFAGFEKDFQGDVVTPTDPDYPKAIIRWARNAQRNARIVAFVKDSKDVSLAIKYAKANKLPIAVRGGGHNPMGASSAEGGLVIDLSRYVNGVKIDPEQKLAFVGGGAVWETVDKNAIEHGLATVAGTVNHTGVGGLLLGGGYGWLSGAYGLVLDNLVQATVVVADGSVLTANETENTDLFFGIRGGGSNFGVCTEFVLKLYPQRRSIFSGIAVFAPDVLEKLTSTLDDWWSKGPSEKEAIIHILTRGPDGHPGALVLFFYNGSEAEGRANFKAFFDLGPVVDMTGEMPYEKLNTIQNPTTEPGSGVYMKGVSVKKPEFVSTSKAFERVIQLSENNEFRLAIIFEYFPLGKIHSVPQGTTAFRRDPADPAANVLALAMWDKDTPENFKYARDAVHEMSGIITEGQAEAGLTKSQTEGYSNYDPDGVAEANAVVPEDKAKVLFGDNYPKLQQIKKKYDPEMVFSKWFAITVPA